MAMTSECCSVCRSWLGIVRSHGEGVACPVQASAWCSQCGCYGHRPADCTVVTGWTRPATLEELIPPEVRERWGIATATPIIWAGAPSVDVAEREISDTNIIEIRYSKGTGQRGAKLDARLREFMRQNRLDTTHSCDANLAKLRRWAVGQGKKIRLVPE